MNTSRTAETTDIIEFRLIDTIFLALLVAEQNFELLYFFFLLKSLLVLFLTLFALKVSTLYKVEKSQTNQI